jgi:hypothetical protein
MCLSLVSLHGQILHVNLQTIYLSGVLSISDWWCDHWNNLVLHNAWKLLLKCYWLNLLLNTWLLNVVGDILYIIQYIQTCVGSFLEGLKLFLRDFNSVNGVACGELLELSQLCVIKRNVEFVQMTGQQVWVCAFELLEEVEDVLSLDNDVDVVAFIVSEQIVVQVVICYVWLLGVEEHVEGDVVGVVLVGLEVVQLHFYRLEPLVGLLELGVVDTL